MSEPMKKHRTKNKETLLKITYKGNLYKIPKAIADKYKVTSGKRVRQVQADSVLADDLFSEIDRKFTKPGALLQGLRYREGLSQQEFAELIEVTQSDLSKMEHGKRPIGKIIAKRIADKFDVDYRMFL